MKSTDTVKAFYRDHKTPVHIIFATLGGIVVLGLIVLFIYNVVPKKVTYKYNPVDACELLTMSEAHKLLGKDVIGSPVNEPAVSGDVATSSCSYTDQSRDRSKMKVMALAVLSAVNDRGITVVRSEFNAKKTMQTSEAVANLGDEAYFDKSLGQLNVLNDKSMLRISYGVGATPEANDMNQAISLARDIIRR